MKISEGKATERAEADRFWPLLYDDMLRLARRRLGRVGRGDGLTPADLVHEAYLRLAGGTRCRFEGKPHFLFALNRAMRDLAVESLRRRATLRRGGGWAAVELQEAETAGVERKDFLDRSLDLRRALRRLAEDDPECARTVVLSYFVGLTHPEIASLTGVSRATVERRWTHARAWLRRELTADPEGISPPISAE